MNKKTVRYSDIGNPAVGRPAYLMAIDHPTAPTGEWIHTSPVVGIGRYLNGPVVETLNTIYVPGFIETDGPIGITAKVPDAHTA